MKCFYKQSSHSLQVKKDEFSRLLILVEEYSRNENKMEITTDLTEFTWTYLFVTFRPSLVSLLQ